jgi:hypothetical protein
MPPRVTLRPLARRSPVSRRSRSGRPAVGASRLRRPHGQHRPIPGGGGARDLHLRPLPRHLSADRRPPPHRPAGARPPGKEASEIVAVSVDPKGDTPKTVNAFLKARRMTGRMEYLIGSRARLERVWSEWNIVSKSSPTRGNPDLVEHSALIYGIDAAGDIRALYRRASSLGRSSTMYRSSRRHDQPLPTGLQLQARPGAWSAAPVMSAAPVIRGSARRRRCDSRDGRPASWSSRSARG